MGKKKDKNQGNGPELTKLEVAESVADVYMVQLRKEMLRQVEDDELQKNVAQLLRVAFWEGYTAGINRDLHPARMVTHAGYEGFKHVAG